MYTYSAFGHILGSDIGMPEFLPAEGSPELFFRFGPIAPPDTQDTHGTAPVRLIMLHGEGILLYWSMIGTFLVEKGRDVTISPLPGVDESLLRLVLTGPALGVLLHQRGYEVFHSSVVADDLGHNAFAFLARKGEGKSTMATAMYNQGYLAMSDDIMACSIRDGAYHVQPAFPHSKLWGESAEALVEEASSLKKLGPGFDKRSRPVKERFNSSPSILKKVFVLEFGGDSKESRLEPLSGTEALRELLPHWYGALFDGQLLDLFGRENHFMECVRFARSVPVFRLTRPRDFEKLDEVVDLVDRCIKDRIPEG